MEFYSTTQHTIYTRVVEVKGIRFYSVHATEVQSKGHTLALLITRKSYAGDISVQSEVCR